MEKRLSFYSAIEEKDKDGITKIRVSHKPLASNAIELPTEGCVDFILFNESSGINARTVLIFGTIAVAPGAPYQVPKSSPHPFINNIPIKWSNDYEVTGNVDDAKLFVPILLD